MDHTEEVGGVVRGLQIENAGAQGSLVDYREEDVAGSEIVLDYLTLEFETGSGLDQYRVCETDQVDVQSIECLAMTSR